MPSLALHGIRVVNHADRTDPARWVARFFEREVRPLLVPVGLDPAHPFPQVANKSLNFIVQLGGATRSAARTRSPSSRCRACCRA
jgi:polyphosphate kinase